MASKIPVTVISGFLGSGKTTLVRHLMTQANGRRLAVIVNEFGDLGFDGDLIEQCGLGCEEEVAGVFELTNGCLCCTVQEEFYPVMKELIERRDDIDHIIIETSGLALPKPLVQAFNWPEISNACTVDAVVTVVDCPAVASGQFAANPKAVNAQRKADENLDHESPLHELFEDQLSAADLVLLSKTDLVDSDALAAVNAQVAKEVGPEVSMIEIQNGEISPSVLLGLEKGSEHTIDEKHSHHDHHHHDEDGHHHHDHDHDAFDSCVFEIGEVDEQALLTTLQSMVERHSIYRVKGYLAVEGKSMRKVLQGVGSRFSSYFDQPFGDAPRNTRLVFIGMDLDPNVLGNELVGE